MRSITFPALALSIVLCSAPAVAQDVGTTFLLPQAQPTGIHGVTTPWQYEAAMRGGLIDAAETYGTQDFGTTQIFAVEFETLADTTTAMSLGGNRYRASGTNFALIARPSIPAGAEIIGATLWAHDADSTASVSWTLYEVDLGLSASTSLGGGSTGTSFDGGNFGVYQSLDSPYVHTGYYDKTLWVLINLSTTGSDVAIRGLTFWWKRQVAPAPASATFNDVPTTHPFFQFVEALAASGITAGTGGGNFGPDDPLTRGQMAVFLSKALGLHWPPN